VVSSVIFEPDNFGLNTKASALLCCVEILLEVCCSKANLKHSGSVQLPHPPITGASEKKKKKKKINFLVLHIIFLFLDPEHTFSVVFSSYCLHTVITSLFNFFLDADCMNMNV